MDFSKKYNRTEFVKFLKRDFLPDDFEVKNEKIVLNKSLRLTTEVTRLGSCDRSLDLIVYEIRHYSKHNSRVALSKEAFRILADEWNKKALIAFVPEDDDSNYRLSLITIDLDIKDNGKTERKYSNPHRYSYYLGEGIAVHTTNLYLNEKGQVSDGKDLMERFSVEVLTKQFYKDLFDWYHWAVDENTNITFPNNTLIEDDDRENIDIKIIRLITRLMFVWFIKQKKLVPDKLFDTSYLKIILRDFDPLSPNDGTYYNAILQNLFFATLNRAIVDDEGKKRGFAHVTSGKDVKTLYRYSELFTISEGEVIEQFAEVPFLNGGLFECLDKTRTIDGVEKAFYYDGFSRNNIRFKDGRYKNRAFVPNELFFKPEVGLFSILNRYNFTIEENTPNEQQVALDPELLGKVFENLLGAYNPETKETARNQSGSFYTPREIVNYMVDESIQSYLGKTPIVMSLFKDDFVKDPSCEADYQNIAKRLKEIKVLDPACGSGAFPMGLLNRLVTLLQKIHTEESTYNLKLTIIENCIFGVDIQSIAAQITKLRFFISLICDCKRDVSKPNFGIPTLPNLETKFVAANSLIAKKKKAIQGNLFEDPLIEKTKKELAKVRCDHFSAKSAYKKIILRASDKELREKLAVLLSNSFDVPEDAIQVASWNPYDQNAVSPFFDPDWMFGIVDGFDIVISNPPYIQLQNNGGELAEQYDNCGYTTFARTGDIYCLFYERGWQLLKQNGHLCYITSNKWMRAGYGEKTRDFFTTKTNPELLIDFAGVKIFESATVDTNILLFSKSTNTHQTTCAVTNKQNKNSVKNLSVFVEQSGNECCFNSSDSWAILSPIEMSIKRKIESIGTPLKDWDIQINYGIKTGLNDAFIIDTEKRNEILSNCVDSDERKRTEEIIRPILRGRDIKRYSHDWANLWLIYIPWHFPLQFDSSIQGASTKAEKEFECLYPAVYTHMLIYKEPLSKRNKAETGIRYEWYAMQRWGANYWEDFIKPKIIWKRVGSILHFSYDEQFTMLLDSTCFATGNNLKYLCCILNSNMGHYLLKDAPKTGTGDLLVSVQAVEPLKIPLLENNIQIYDELLDSQIKKEEKSITNKINKMVYKLYNLSELEVTFIEHFVTQFQKNQ